MKRSLLISFLTPLLSACSGQSDVLPSSDSFDQRNALIVVHGYYGSALKEKNTGTRRFIRVSTILAGHFAIALESEKLGLRRSPELAVEGVIAKVPLLFGLIGNDVYGEWLRELEEKTGRQVLVVAYDWRKDPFLAVEALGQVVDQLKARGVQKISLAGHSMGGLVVGYYLGYGTTPPEKAKLNWQGARNISDLAFFATPFRGAISILRNMQSGTGYSWNKKMLEAGTVASFPASYHILPLNGPIRLKHANGEDHPYNLADFTFWRQHRLGLLKEDPPNPAVGQNREAYSEAQVRRAALYLRLLEFKGEAPPKGTRIFSVEGQGKPTLATGYFDPATGELLFQPEEVKAKNLSFEAIQAEGDGTVTLASAAVPSALSAFTQVHRTTYAHDKVFLDPKIEKDYVEFLRSH